MKHHQKYIEAIMKHDVYKKTPLKLYYSTKSVNRIGQFLLNYHPNDLHNVVNTFRRCCQILETERLVIFEGLNQLTNSFSLHMCSMKSKDEKLVFRFYNPIEYRMNRMKNWKQLGYKSSRPKLLKYELEITFMLLIKDNDVKFYNIDKFNQFQQITNDQQISEIYRLVVLSKYDDYRDEYDDIANHRPKGKSNKTPKKKTFDVKHMFGNEHIHYDRAGQRVMDTQTGEEYISIMEMCRQLNLEDIYYPIVHSTRKNMNTRFKRF